MSTRVRQACALFWVLVVCLSLSVVLYKVSSGLPLETNIVSLLPEQAETPDIRQVKEHLHRNMTNRVVLLIGNKDFAKAKGAALTVEQVLAEQEFLDGRRLGQRAQQTKEFFAQLFPYRDGLLSAKDRAMLEDDKGELISRRVIAQLRSPFAMVDRKFIAGDPFLTFSRYLNSLQYLRGKVSQKDGVPFVLEGDVHFVVLALYLKQSPFSEHHQHDFTKSLNAAIAKSQEQFGPQTILKTGAIFYAKRAAETAKAEATLIGSFSAIGIAVLTLLVFRSLQPLGLILLAVISGVLAGAGVSLFVFDKLNVIAVVFGAALIGIAVDYAFHYCCERFRVGEGQRQDRVNNILPALTMGLCSTVIGFSALSLAPFPGLRQISIFAASGLIISYVTVIAIYPYIDRAPSTPKSFVGLLAWDGLFNKISGRLISVVVFMAGLIGIASFQIDDDIRSLKSIPQDLYQQELVIKEKIGLTGGLQVLLVEADTTDQALMMEERVISKLSALQDAGDLHSFQALANIVPSQERQAENKKLLHQKLMGPFGKRHRDVLGLGSSTIKPAQTDFLDLDKINLAGAPGAANLLALSGEAGKTLHLIMLNGVSSPDKLIKLAEDEPGITYIDPVQEMTSQLGYYRFGALVLLSGAVGLIYLFLSTRYGWKDALAVIMGPVLAAVLSPFILSAIGLSFTFFNATGLILVFAIGLDYALFYREGHAKGAGITTLANGLSALSTIMAFGFLSFSDTYALKAFGATVFVGIILAFWFSPLAGKKDNV